MTRIKIAGPEPESGLCATLSTRGTKVLIHCDCSVADPCPQGRVAARCGIWMERAHLTDAAVERERALNRFGR